MRRMHPERLSGSWVNKKLKSGPESSADGMKIVDVAGNKKRGRRMPLDSVASGAFWGSAVGCANGLVVGSAPAHSLIPVRASDIRGSGRIR